MNKRDIVTLVILGIIFAFIFVIILLIGNNEEDIKNKSEYNELTLVSSESIFLSVSNNINKICEYSNDNISLNFIMKDEINKNEYKNILFQAEQMYVVSNLNLYKYYVKGQFYKNVEDTIPEYIKDGYFILNYDIETTSYNIEKITKERYENAKSEEYIFEKINSNDYNRFKYSNLNNKSRALLYFNDFLNKIYSAPEKAYNLLTSETRNSNFNTYNQFKEFISNYNNITMKEYSVNGNKIGIKDNYDNEYIFKITYVLEYSVAINQTGE